MTNVKYGYIQKYDNKQKMESEVESMEENGVDKSNIYIDKQWEDKSFHRMLKKLKDGDIVYIDSLRSLGESYYGMSSKWHLLADKKAEINTLDFTDLSTSQPINGVDANVMIDTAFYFFEYIRWAERQNARLKQAQGIAEAKKKGIKLGRRSLEIPENFDEVYEKWMRQEISGRAASNMLNVDHKTFKKWAMEKKRIK